MSTAPTLWNFISDADWVVKAVMLILLAASIAAWTIIFQRIRLFKRTRIHAKQFEHAFWNANDLNQLHQSYQQEKFGLASIFCAGLTEFLRLREKPTNTANTLLNGAQRAMRVCVAREQDRLERHLSFLATVGSVSPYIGLFGTVWGIMSAFRALGGVQQATIAMVAPGISEALIATAIGLFAAIPAVIAYNRLSNELERLLNQYDTFQDEFTGILQHQE